jgi:hypothetical protein
MDDLTEEEFRALDRFMHRYRTKDELPELGVQIAERLGASVSDTADAINTLGTAAVYVLGLRDGKAAARGGSDGSR